MISVQCPQCRAVLAFEDSMAGAVVACPDCEAKVGVPGLREWPTENEEPLEEAPEPEVSAEDEEVLAELEQLQNRKPGWGGAIVLLIISMILYTGAAGGQQGWNMEAVFILVAVLAFHESGHYVAMRLFGYRNLRMFFIPFFGAAVSGQNYNVLGWKKVVVALAGPLPGIVVGSITAVAGFVLQEPLALLVASNLLILNGFNLLPFLPLDGGWVVHAILFVRHPVLDVVFRLVAALAMLALAYLASSWLLGVIAGLMLISAPVMYRLATIAHRLGQEGLAARSMDGQSIPRESALRILGELRPALPQQTAARVMAQHVANVFEMFNAEPPGVLASAGFLVLHAGSFIAAAVMSVVIYLFQNRVG